MSERIPTPEEGVPLGDVERLDALLQVVRSEALRWLRGEMPEAILLDDAEGTAIRAASLSLLLLVRRSRERDVTRR